MWDAALVISYEVPVAGREAKAMDVFADALTTFGKLAADGKCAEPEVFHHLVGGGMLIVKVADTRIAHEILELEHVRRIIDTAVFTVGHFRFDIMVTGEKLMENMSFYTTVGTELGYI